MNYEQSQSSEASEGKISRSLGLFDGIFMVLGLVIGVGIYQTPSQIAGAAGSSWGVVGVWILGGILTFAGSMVYAELGSRYPKEGGDFYFLERMYGETVSFLYGWCQLIVIGPGIIAALSFPVTNHLLELLHVLGFTAPVVPSYIVGVILIILLSLLNMIHGEVSRVIQIVFAGFSGVFLFGLGLWLVFGFQPSGTVVPESVQSPDYGLALILVLFTYGGWSELTFLGEEIRNPQTTVPWILAISVSLLTLLYVMINFGLCHALGVETLANSDTPVIQVLPGGWRDFIYVPICGGLLCALYSSIRAGSRLWYAVGRRYKAVHAFGVWDSASQVPRTALAGQMIVSGVITLLAGSFSAVLVYTSAIVWMFYLLVGIGTVRLRYKEPPSESGYSMALYPLPVVLFIVSSLFMVWSSVNYDMRGTLITAGIGLTGLIVKWCWGEDEQEEG